MEPVNLSILVVNCKQYIPSYNWYFCKSGRYFCGIVSEELYEKVQLQLNAK